MRGDEEESEKAYSLDSDDGSRSFGIIYPVTTTNVKDTFKMDALYLFFANLNCLGDI